ncbi:hypothetical protein RO3G_06580 [Rhizopus delemar RA 99-880]|uniref:Programmed cell death protein 5 n=1 Tax=Rhizopus delemar (strain RA 99-880 / ATCC MYA-4621 / FGSC 9543 / NRRL 43880) TaxID=246409 RepID=I1C095_RHIO9|nr:hypothetical protein RO3G_06580 [Rhizopus delemar RA 99-880]|eukprot:EIE81875.1 hypothetical protein RO3G_06580 [Rhizopus delemar RA 99-880]
MEDDELQAIRARRLAELQAKSGSAQPSQGGFPSAGGASKEDAEKSNQMEEMRRNMLYQILDNSARERCQINQQETSATQTRIVYNRRQYDDSDDDYDL